MKKLTLFIAILIISMGLFAAGFTDSGWTTTQLSVGGEKYNIHTCTIGHTTNDSISYTAKTPTSLKTDKPILAMFNTEGNTLDASTITVDLVLGYSASAALTGNSDPATFTDCVNWKNIHTGIESSVGTVLLDPNQDISDVADEKEKLMPAPYLIFYLEGSTPFAAKDCVIYLIQKASGY